MVIEANQVPVFAGTPLTCRKRRIGLDFDFEVSEGSHDPLPALAGIAMLLKNVICVDRIHAHLRMI